MNSDFGDILDISTGFLILHGSKNINFQHYVKGYSNYISKRPIEYRGFDTSFEDQISLIYKGVFQKSGTKPISVFKTQNQVLYFSVSSSAYVSIPKNSKSSAKKMYFKHKI